MIDPPQFSARRLLAVPCGLVILALPAAALSAQTSPSASRDGDAPALRTQIAALRGITTLEAQFVCEKRLASLATPLVCSGRIWTQAPQRPADAPALRLATQRPYVSELILAHGKSLARSQHETDWTASSQSARPGLTAVMVEVANWSTGAAGHLEWFAVTRGGDQKNPAPPPASLTAAPSAELFVLTPVNQDLLLSVKRLTLGFAPGPAAPPADAAGGKPKIMLAFFELVTAQDDITRYWFSAPTINAAAPPDLFAPTGGR